MSDLEYDDLALIHELEEVKRQLERAKLSARVYADERDAAYARLASVTAVLSRIYNLIYPPTFKVGGVLHGFKSPHLHEQMQALSDIIRGIPDQLEKAKKSVWPSYGGGPITGINVEGSVTGRVSSNDGPFPSAEPKP